MRSEHRDGDQDQHPQVRAPDAHAGDGPGAVERTREVRAGVGGLRDLDGDGLSQTGDADRGHQHDDPGRVLQPADDRHLHGGAEDEADEQRDDQGDPEGDAVLEHEQGERHGADDAHVADGEVDDPGGAVHQHDARRR